MGHTGTHVPSRYIAASVDPESLVAPAPGKSIEVNSSRLPLGKTFVGLRWVREAVAFYCFVRFTLPETATLQPGWAIGEAILHTTNGGLSLGYQGYRGHGISFVDRNTGWAVGAGGAILHTTTGGE